MTYRQKMQQHLDKFEKYQALVDKYEREAMESLSQRLRRPANSYEMARDLEGFTPYTDAVSGRNGHQKAATLYALVALVTRD